ncbi:MAG: bifunctional glutamate N-acetyltransferase/amino-acid acetyltransferase ArgJ [Pirellulaceae bacterium]|nr:bifunctional glutamate N-acetyltransferase/amino-acid acetyltransferase ArgJ [Pirellulaceae bacterium]
MLSIPSGFQFSTVTSGVKKSLQDDLVVVLCPTGATAAGVYTQNQIVAAPVVWSQERTPLEPCYAVVVNSGNANACTGKQGEHDTHEIATLVAKECQTYSAESLSQASCDEILVMSTGVIGQFLPMEKIREGIRNAFQKFGHDEEATLRAARGIMTTDQGEKTGSRTVEVSGKSCSILGLAKGAGMIGPNMATMLGLLLTDAPLTKEQAQQSLTVATSKSFNAISVEGHTSTNDTVLLLASGTNRTEGLTAEEFTNFTEELTLLCIDLAKKIPSDGEGAKHLIEIQVQGAKTAQQADIIARTVASSALVKTAIAGGDPNWGRIVSAAGYAGVDFDPDKITLWLNDHLLYQNGRPADFSEKEVSDDLNKHFETKIRLVLEMGQNCATHWTSDLTTEYVHFNSAYRT